MRYGWIIVLLLLVLLPVKAQDSAWTIWLYDQETGDVLLVDNTGTVQESLALPVPAPYVTWEYSRLVGVSPDGTRLAYVVTGTDIGENEISTFLVYDAAAGRVLFNFDQVTRPDATSLDFTTVAFNSTGNAVAYSFATGDTWRIIIFNAIDGRIISELDSASPSMTMVSRQTAPLVLPGLQHYGEAEVAFNLIPYQTLGSGIELLSYEWDIVTGRVVQSNRAPRLTGDTLPVTGETVLPVLDERVNYNASLAPYTNAVHVYRPQTGARAPFYATRTYDILGAIFVQNGERVAIRVQDLVTFDFTRLLIDRTGISRTLPPINARDDRIVGTPDGLAYVLDQSTPFLVSLDTRRESFPQTAIYGLPAESRMLPVWASLQEEASSYGAWAQLAPPLFTAQALLIPDNQATGVPAQSVSTATPFGDTGGALTVNAVAFINTTEGDRLNMRDRPGLGTTIIARIENGTRVVVTDGPVTEDGFTWWQVRLTTGTIGWVVERADGVRTLIPAG